MLPLVAKDLLILVMSCPLMSSGTFVTSQAYRSISKCVAAICDSVPGETFSTVEKFVNDIKVCSGWFSWGFIPCACGLFLAIILFI